MNPEKSDFFAGTGKNDHNMLKSHWQYCPALLEHVEALVGNRKVVSARATDENECMESYPCQGHGDLILSLEDGTTVNVGASSVGIGVIQKRYFPNLHTHFTEYAEGYADWVKKQ